MSSPPPRCPNSRCLHHRARPATGSAGEPFFRRKGSFPRAGERRVARYQCKTCRRHFSEQTFSPDYREKKPEIGPAVARLLAAGYSQRSSARLLGVNRKTVARRVARIRRAARPRGGGPAQG